MKRQEMEADDMSYLSQWGTPLELLQWTMERTGSRIDADISRSGAANIKSTIISCLAWGNPPIFNGT